jgi:hypothetical protein
MLTCVYRDHQSDIRVNLDRLIAQHQIMEITGAKELQNLRKYFMMALEFSRKEMLACSTRVIADFKDELLELLEVNERAVTTQTIIQSLKYDQMVARRRSIEDACKNTFTWIFDDTSDGKQTEYSFLEWLKCGDGVYWVAGRAGSGKSTFMKYLSEHPETETWAKSWAEGKEIIIASHFFWTAGTKMQKSQEGLLSSLLDTVFSRCPALIPIVAPWRWEGAKDRNPDSVPWTLKELREVFALLTQQSKILVRFCFFIDGLDEYDGDHYEIVRVLQNFATSSSVKLCVSSRPGNVFKKSLGKYSFGQLHLEDFTRNDIRLYVCNTLTMDPHFLELEQEDDRTTKQKIIETIADMAHGVFLWVVLVLRDIRRGLSNLDTVPMLQQRVDSLPPTLEGYFELMFDRIDAVYREQTAQTFLLLLEVGQNVPLMMLAFLDRYRTKDSIERPIQFMSIQARMALCEKTRTRVKAQCCDLLEVTFNHRYEYIVNPRVIFLQRSVKDWLLTPDGQKQLHAQLRAPFDPHAYCCDALLALLKILPPHPHYIGSESLKVATAKDFVLGMKVPMMNDFMFHACAMEQSETPIDLTMLDELERVMEHHATPKDFRLDSAWLTFLPQWPLMSKSTLPQVAERFRFAPPGRIVFQAAIQFGLVRYVEKRLSREPQLINGSCDGWLDVPLHTAVTSPATEGNRVDPSMVKLLLDHGALPCQRVQCTHKLQPTTVWKEAVNRVISARESEGTAWIQVLELLLTADTPDNSTMVRDLEPSGALAKSLDDRTMWTLREIAGVADHEWRDVADHGWRDASWWFVWLTCCTTRKRRDEESSEMSPLLQTREAS